MTQRSFRCTAACAFTIAMFAVSTLGAQAQTHELPPPLGTPKPFLLPPKHELTLANGMKVTLVRFGTVPKVSIYCDVRTGHIDEKSNEVSLSDITGEMLREGTTTRSATQIEKEVGGMGGSLSIGVDDDDATIGGTVLSENGPDMVRLVADVIRNPLLPESEFARVIANQARNVAISRSQPQAIAREQFLKTLYGDHPYGRVFPTDAMLKSYTIAQVKDFYTRNFGATRAHVYVVGVFDEAQMERAVRDAFTTWAAGSAPTIKPPVPHKGRSVTLLDRPAAVQSTIMLGLPVPDPASKDRTALEVTDAMLGGTFGSRITTNIRENKGYTYSPFSSISTHYHDSYWTQQADVTTKFTGASLKEIFGEIDRLQKEAPGTSELDGIKNNMIGLFTLQNGSRTGIVTQLEEADVQGLGGDYLSGYVKRVLAVTPSDVQRMTATYLKPSEMTLVVVGDKATVAEQLAPYELPVP
jgi:zinc protease